MSIPSTTVTWEYRETITSEGEPIYGGWNGYVGGFKVPATIQTDDGDTHTLDKILINGSEYSGA